MHQSPRDSTDTVVAVFDSLDPTLDSSVEYKLALCIRIFSDRNCHLLKKKNILNIVNVIQFKITP
jgi:hypothetical protein